MPVLIDATVSGTAANSFVTDDQFVAYLQSRPYAPAGLDADERGWALLAATHDLEALVEWNGARVGWRASRIQALRFPAHWTRNRWDDGYYAVNVNPDFIQLAEMEQAIGYLNGDPRLPSVDAIKSVKVDTIEVVFNDQTGIFPGQVMMSAAVREIGFWAQRVHDGVLTDGASPIVLV